jgi:hypothetical protein
MGNAKVVSLTVRPFQISHLCFEIGGILGELYPATRLGRQIGSGLPVTPFDFNAFYTTLSGFPTAHNDPSRLRYGVSQIQNFVTGSALATLRAESAKADLDKAINARQNAYFAKYGHISRIVHETEQTYSPSPSVPDSKPNRLAKLSDLAFHQAHKLDKAYREEKRTGVIKWTKSVLNSKTWGGGSNVDESSDTKSLTDLVGANTVLTPPPENGLPGDLSFPGGNVIPSSTLEEETSGETITNTGKIRQHQTIVNTDYGYRIPYIESQAQNERAQISLLDQKFAQFMYSQNLPNLSHVLNNERNSIDSDVYRLQIAFLNSILLSPISGTVTGIYKNPGDPVKAGEPVIRVENDHTIFLSGTVVYPGPIVIAPPGVPPPANSSVTVHTNLFGSTPLSPPLAGKVVAVRGQGQEDHWAVIVQCDNPLDSSGINRILPLGYQFDYDDTSVTIN